MNTCTLHHGDCLGIMRGMEADSIDLTVTSPPYDNLRTYNGFTFDFEGIARELYRVTKPGGVVVWVVGDATIKGSETGTSFRQALFFKDVCGFNLHDTMIYKKTGTPFPDSVRYYQNFEFMFVFSKGAPRAFNAIADRTNKWAGSSVHGTNRKADGFTEQIKGNGKAIRDVGVRYNVWEIANQGKAGMNHPATFPEPLARDHIISWSNPGDLVLDPFVGSGTTGKMALATGRRFVGIDISHQYLEIARQRIASAANDNKPLPPAEAA